MIRTARPRRVEGTARARPATAGLFAVVPLVAALATLGGCGGSGAAEGEEDRVLEVRRDAELWEEARKRGLPVERRTFTGPDGFEGYWKRRPIPLQGEPPPAWSDLEASLGPSACGTCHAQQYEDWRATVHARAYSPGLSGQLVNWEESAYGAIRSCLACHAPLEEQSALVPDSTGRLVPNPFFDRALQREGLVCAACHLRGNRRHGPPRRDGSTAPSPPAAPHGGVERTGYFEDSRFCATCHQFASPAANGKSLQNTFVEWRESRWAREGVSCQACHMPDRRHLWRGIHDPGMVRSGVTIEWIDPEGRLLSDGAARDGRPVSLRIRNTGTGHRFPTYVTPEVDVLLQLLDESGGALDGGEVTGTIGRRVRATNRGWVEDADTRIPPDSAYVLTVDPAGWEAAGVAARVEVRPDAFYRNLFAGMLRGTLSDTSRSLIGRAHEHARSSPFLLFRDTLRLR